MRGHFRDRKKSGTIAQENSMQQIIFWGSRIGYSIYQTKIKSRQKSRISSKKSARNKFAWSMRSQSDSLHKKTDWIICSTGFSIISGFGGWRFSLSCSWFDKYWTDDSFRTDKNKNKKSSPRMRWFCASGTVEILIVCWMFIAWRSKEVQVDLWIKLQELHAFKEKDNEQVLCCY